MRRYTEKIKPLLKIGVFLFLLTLPLLTFASGGEAHGDTHGHGPVVLQNIEQIQKTAFYLFAAAVIHALFLTRIFNKLAHKYEEGTIPENLFHFLGEAEVVFGIWAAVFCGFIAYYSGLDAAVNYINCKELVADVGGTLKKYKLNFTEPAFVFAIMAISSTRPIIYLADKLIGGLSTLMPSKSKTKAFVLSALIFGPLLGSFITEPAAMTVTALLLRDQLFKKDIPESLKYAVIGTLFVNVSIGGTLTHFAAPPVLMVAGAWHWGMGYMITHFGFKAAIAVVVSSGILVWRYGAELENCDKQTQPSNQQLQKAEQHLIKGKKRKRKQLQKIQKLEQQVAQQAQVIKDLKAGTSPQKPESPKQDGASNLLPMTWWLVLVHLLFMAAVVFFNHYFFMFLGIFVFFLGFVEVTQEYQKPVDLKSPMLVAFFLGGLVTLGGFQGWWIQPLIEQVGDSTLFLGATGLTAITDNAALTYLGSLVEGISETAKYALVSGAVAGGGLTIMANAPNPAGNAVLGKYLSGGLSTARLLKAAALPTIIAMICFLIPSIAP